MASRHRIYESSPPLQLEEELARRIPRRANRPAVQESWSDDSPNALETWLVGPLKGLFFIGLQIATIPLDAVTSVYQWITGIIDFYRRNDRWLKPWLICMVLVISFMGVLLSAGIVQRSVAIISTKGQVYAMQVGGNQADSWQHDPQAKIPSQAGPYSVLGNPSITVDFINRVLSNYRSPAAGKGQTLHDLGKQYGIDPAFALAFFMHESSFGNKGEATKSLSLGNLRCIPNFRCEDNFAQFDSWEDGFKAWYQLIRNLYVSQWGLTTVDQIIPRYAPSADNNNEQGYIAALKHAIDTWHAGQVVVR
jgi:Mannosyl-glycoprotein endo-beta-N-acetylglucosaminidase